ncbi:hypothetical protein ACFY2M_13505 [Streptomyces sp. NPDC001276]|uniref:hypothetical protein n=1 Tax=Streptomyces sp. NPDC001276 TaxID=3364555 RepID=UPI0036C41799
MYREQTLLGQDMPAGTADRLRELIRNIEKALFIVQLEGPEQVAAKADEVMNTIADWQASVIVTELRNARNLPPRDDVPVSVALHHPINQALASFKTTARAALDAQGALSQG